MATTAQTTQEKPATEARKPVPANPALIEWPSDRWGFTSDVKKAILNAASGVRGQKDKHDLLLMVLGTAAKHIIARYESDKANAERLRIELEEHAAKRDVAHYAALGYTHG